MLRIQWDEDKRQSVLNRRNIDFAQITELFSLPYIEDQRNDEPEQYRVIGFIGNRLVTFIVEYRQDEQDEYIWVVTAWNSTRQEQQDYEYETS
ncbi:BrnT family toxin [Chloroflexi bacterium TSY]|nr:BrnT family toxin [Chloroflexi bacterium TSY]